MADVEKWLHGLEAAAGRCDDFRRASSWLDLAALVEIGRFPLWMKIYRGRIIEALRYNRETNMIGYDVHYRGERDRFAALVAGETQFVREIATGRILHDGRRIATETSFQALTALFDRVLPAIGLPPARSGETA